MSSDMARRLAIPAGFILGAGASIGAQWLSAVTTGGSAPDVMASAAQHVVVGLAVAIRWSPPVAAWLAAATATTPRAWRSLAAVTLWFVPCLAVLLVAAPDAPGRALIFLYAASIVFDWAADQTLGALEQGTTAAGASIVLDCAADLTPLPPSLQGRGRMETRGRRPLPFREGGWGVRSLLAAGLVMLALVPLLLLANQPALSVRAANWAFGFLALGTGLAVLVHLPFVQRLERLRFAPELGVAGVVVLLVGMGLALDRTGLSGAESLYVSNLNPNYLAGRVKANDVVLSDSADLNLSALPAIFPYLNLRPDERGASAWDEFARLLQGKRKVFWVRVPHNSTDSQGRLAAFLKANGCLNDIYGTDLPVWVYELRQPLERPRVLVPALANETPDAFDKVDVDFGAVRLAGLALERQVCSHDAVAIALRWQLDRPASGPLQASFAIKDARGQTIETLDTEIRDAAGQGVDRWPAGVAVSAYYTVPVPFGTSPGDYALALTVYGAGGAGHWPISSAHGVTTEAPGVVRLGQFHVYRANDLAADPFKTADELGLLPAHVEFGTGLLLEAYSVANRPVLPGTTVEVLARWRALRDDLPATDLRVQILRGDRLIAQTTGAPVAGAYPTDRWVAGERVLDRRRLRVPPDTEGGKVRLEIGVDGGRMLYLADVTIAPVTRTFEIASPHARTQAAFGNVAALVGYDLAQTQVTAGRPLDLILDWQALASDVDRDYAVFAQLLAADGHLVAQSDGAPAAGARPTQTWLRDEIIQDRRTLRFGDAHYRGDATLIVGMYDPATGDRVSLPGSRENAFTLPVRISVVAP